MKLQRVEVGARVNQIVTMSVVCRCRAIPHQSGPRSSWTTPSHGCARCRVSACVRRVGLAARRIRWKALTIAGRPDRILVRFKRVDAEYFNALEIP
jgi:hypothetical protein